MKKTDNTRRVVVRAFGGPDQLQVKSVQAPPRPGPGELLVEVEAAGINYLDVYQRQGIHGGMLPLAVGLEGVGHVREVGTGVDADGALGVARRGTQGNLFLTP